MAWRVVKSLDQLLAQINELAPGRSKASDGSIGDAAHQRESSSDHNPRRYAALGPTPVVAARDFTHDPAHGADMGPISEMLRLSGDRRVGYIIFNRRITGPSHGWHWVRYTGTSAHTEHMHVSTVHTAIADDTSPWHITGGRTVTQPNREERNSDQYWYEFANGRDPISGILGGDGKEILPGVPNVPLQLLRQLLSDVSDVKEAVATLTEEVRALRAAIPNQDPQ